MTIQTKGGSSLSNLRELYEKATKGEWKAGRMDMESYTVMDGPFKNIYVDSGDVNDPHLIVARGEGDDCRANARLIAAAHNLLPELLAVVEAAEGVVTLSRPYRLNDEGCRAAMEELLLKVEKLNAALSALKEKEGKL